MNRPTGKGPIRYWLGAALTVLTLVGSLFAAAAPAQAYGDLRIEWIRVDTDDCREIDRSDNGRFPEPDDDGDECILPDSIDGTYFKNNVDAVALKVMAYESNVLVAKYEFHPWGEVHWVYDTRSDGDRIYWHVSWFEEPGSIRKRTLWVPGTGAPVDFINQPLPTAEGTPIRVRLWDDPGPADLIAADIPSGRA